MKGERGALRSVGVTTAGVIVSLIMPVALAQVADGPATAGRGQDNGHAWSRDAPARPPADSGNADMLDAIDVTGAVVAPDYHMTETRTATGTDTPLIDVPQSIQAIPRKVLRDQASQSLADAMRNTPGVYVQQGEGNRDEFYLRGVKTKSDFFVDGLRDDSEYFRDLYNVAHVDVLRGPAALLFGRGGAGGIINLVTKQPERRRIRNLTFEAGSHSHLRSELDVGGPVGEKGAFRVLAMGENSDSFRENYYLHRYAINPKLSFQLDDRTQLDLDFSYLDDHRLVDRGIPSRNGRPVDVPRDRFFGSPDENFARSTVTAFSARIAHEVNDNLTLRNALRVSENDRDYRNVYPSGAVDDNGQVELSGYRHPNNRLSYLDRAEAVATFDTGILSHKLLFGTELGWQRGNDRETLPAPGSKDLPGSVPVTNPTVSNVSFDYLDRQNHVVGKELGLFAQDQVSLGEHWKALAGVRWDRFSVDADYQKPGVSPSHTHNVDTEWSPRAGLVYKPVENDSIYTSVTQTYTPQGANIALSRKSPKGADLDPQKATNYEIGNKLDLFDGDLSITAALFQLDLKNVVSKAPDGSGRLVSTGRQRNRGFELSTEGALTSQWSLFANYTYLDAKITETTKKAEAGSRVGLVPRNQFSIWTRYELTPRWGVGGGIRGASEKYTSYNNDVTLPGFAEADAMAYYQGDNYRVQVNLNNITDKTYYPTATGDNQISPGAPRSVIASLSVDF